MHVRKHYPVYKERCKKAGIPENHHALPRDLYRKVQEMKNKNKLTGKVQSTLDGVLEKVPEVKTYTRDGATHAVAQLIACDDQVRVMVILHVDVVDIVGRLGPGSCAC